MGWKPKWRSHFSVCSHELFSMAHLFSGNQIVLQCWVKSETALSSHCLMQRSDRCQLLLTSCSVFCQLWSELAKTYFSDAVALFSDYLVHALNHTHTPNTWLSSYSLVLILTRLLQMDPTSASVTRQKKIPPKKPSSTITPVTGRRSLTQKWTAKTFRRTAPYGICVK